MTYREPMVHLIAYNLLRAVIASSGAPGNASFKGALDRINRWLPALSENVPAKTRKRLVDDLHELIAEDLVPDRPGRREPRAVKRRPKPFQLMTRPRAEMVEISHRSRYRKPA